MNSIRIYEKPLCCPTGICGTNIDKSLVEFNQNFKNAIHLGLDIKRFNMKDDIIEFNSNLIVSKYIQEKGIKSLPLVLVNNTIVIEGKYPTLEQIKALSQ